MSIHVEKGCEEVGLYSYSRAKVHAKVFGISALIFWGLLVLSLLFFFPNPFVYLLLALTFTMLAAAFWISARSIRKSVIRMVRQWEEETRIISYKNRHPLFKRLVACGMPIVPILLKELKPRDNHVFWILAAITGENLIPPDKQGNLDYIREKWFAWGKKNGYI